MSNHVREPKLGGSHGSKSASWLYYFLVVYLVEITCEPHIPLVPYLKEMEIEIMHMLESNEGF